MDSLSKVWTVVRCIQPGEVASYGAVGQALENPASGWQVGRWMAQCPSDVPWWRVVAKSGNLPVAKRDARFGIEQAERLTSEGVELAEGAVSPQAFLDPAELADRAARSRHA